MGLHHLIWEESKPEVIRSSHGGRAWAVAVEWLHGQRLPGLLKESWHHPKTSTLLRLLRTCPVPASRTQNSTSPHSFPEGSDCRGTHELGPPVRTCFSRHVRQVQRMPTGSSVTQPGPSGQASLPKFSGVCQSLQDTEVPKRWWKQHGAKRPLLKPPFSRKDHLSPPRTTLNGSRHPHRDSWGKDTLCCPPSQPGVADHAC